MFECQVCLWYNVMVVKGTAKGIGDTMVVFILFEFECFTAYAERRLWRLRFLAQPLLRSKLTICTG